MKLIGSQIRINVGFLEKLTNKDVAEKKIRYKKRLLCQQHLLVAKYMKKITQGIETFKKLNLNRVSTFSFFNRLLKSRYIKVKV